MSTLVVRNDLLERLTAARSLTDGLFVTIRPECFYERPIRERHRVIFYLGHLEAFDWNLIRTTLAGLSNPDSDFDKLFAFGIDPMGGALPSDVRSDWPSLDHVCEYRDRIRTILDREMLRLADRPQFSQLLNVSIEHRLMHAETLSYMWHWLEPNCRISQPQPTEPAIPSGIAQMVHVPAGAVTLGMRRNETFGWDNEFEETIVQVPAFAIDKYKVTNIEFLSFVRSGGYSERSLWPDTDWNWKEKEGLRHPKFWNERNDQWTFRSIFGERPLPPDWPVYVSHAEASAYARWAGKLLPSEAQWQRAAQGIKELRGNFDFQRWDPVSVAAYPESASACGAVGMVGNGWEWSSTTFAPFAGFEPFPFYPGYSADFFDEKHFVLKGGSARTAACMLRPSFRNWFHAHYPHIYAGFRCVSP